MASNPPKYVGNYHVEKTLGEGSFGKVKLGTHVLTQQKVAIKVLDRAKFRNGTDMIRVNREIAVLRLLHHPYIARLYEVVETPNEVFLVLEHASGGELFDYIVARGRVKEKEARKFFRQICSAVWYCHKHSVIHRDLKPENLLLDEKRNIKIIDFGFSNTIQSDRLLNTFCGSPAYAAPEMIAGKEYTGPEVDLWSMGVILYALLAGFLPFDDDSLPKLYQSIMVGEYEKPSFMTKQSLDLIGCLLRGDPKTRYNIKQTVEHPWMNEGYDGPISPPPEREHVSTVDDAIIAEMVEMGFDAEKTEKMVMDNAHNQLSATYFLLGDRMKRDRERAAQEGVNSLASSPRRSSRGFVPRVSSPLASPGAAESRSPGSSPLNSPRRDSTGARRHHRTASGGSSGSGRGRRESGASPLRAELFPNKPGGAKPKPSPRGDKLNQLIAADRRAGRRSSLPTIVTRPEATPVKSPAAPTSLSQSAEAAVPVGAAEKKNPVSRVKQPRRKFSLDAAAAAMAAAVGRRGSKSEPATTAGPQLRTVKGVFSVSTTSSKEPPVIMEEVIRVLTDNDISFMRANYCVTCTAPGVSFEIEVVRIPNMVLYGLRLKRLTGDTWAYKRLCHTLVSQMKL